MAKSPPLLRLVPLLILACQASLAAVAEPMGRVVMLRGEAFVVAADGVSRPLARNAQVYPGETLRTGDASRLQLRMADNGLLALQPGSEFRLISFPGPSPTEFIDYELLRGGFFTLGGGNPFRVEASLATVEGEGSAECFRDVQLYCGVYDGGLRLSNTRGSLQLGLGGAHDFAQVPTDETGPIGLLSRPEELAGPGPDAAPASAGPDRGATGRSGAPSVPIPLSENPAFPEPAPIVVTPRKQ